MKNTVKIIDYSQDLKSKFYDINNEWISNMFEMEDVDSAVLKVPETHIISKGGKVWFGSTKDLGVVGTCALKKTEDGVFELTKMGVLKTARGRKVGEALLKHVIEYAKNTDDVKTCYLLTNKNCEAAIHLYLKNGFIHDEAIKSKYGQDYERCNVAMRLS